MDLPIHRAFNTLYEMLVDRDMPEDAALMKQDIYGPDELTSMYRREKTMVTIPLKTVNIVLYTQVHLVLKDFRSAFTAFKEANKSYIIVMHEKPNQGLMKELKDTEAKLSLPFANLFTYKQLLFNPTRHQLVPKHSKLNPTEVKLLLETNSVKNRYSLPWIQHSDPIAQYLGLKAGDVVKILRDSVTACEYESYRCCV